nr:PREDICTED: uncharacterized protein LOC103280946 [Anolis carolinensis]|eukprot:XP_008119582.1 PREDICTED: uncharacterized protein LOC103280946 [Anolis carolinensis]
MAPNTTGFLQMCRSNIYCKAFSLDHTYFLRRSNTEIKMASRPVEEQNLLTQPTPVTNTLAQDAISEVSETRHDANPVIHNRLESQRVIQTPLRSQKEKESIEERLQVYCYLPKRREPLGFYMSRSIPSKVDCFRKKRPTEAGQDNFQSSAP